MTDAARTTQAAHPRTLRGYLAARSAQAALASSIPATPAPPDDATLAEAVHAIARLDLPPAKLALLRTSLAPVDIPASARRLTATQAEALLSERAATSRRTRGADDAADALTLESLDTMTADAWADFASWLLEQEGTRVESRPFTRRDGLVAWRAEQGERRLVACAWRTGPGWPLLEDDLLRMAALAAAEPGAALVIVTTAEATLGARLAAQHIGDVRFIDRPALALALAGLATAYQREQERTQDEAKARAKAAAAARKKLISALTTIDEAARAEAAKQKPTGRAAVRKAATQVEQSRRLAAQALMAWETLVTDWRAAFDERPARDGTLTFTVEAPAYADLAERADHLKKPLLDALRALAKTPSDGDLGYAAWRQAIGEELAARCAALRAHAQMVDPTRWQDYAEAVDNHAFQAATNAENAATHAAARVARARAALVERIGAL